MFDRAFLEATAERAIKTFAQALIAIIGTDMVGITTLDWPKMLGVAATATVLSILTSIVSANFGKNAGPSLATESTEPDVEIVEVQVKPAAKKASAKKAPAKKAPAKKTPPKK